MITSEGGGGLHFLTWYRANIFYTIFAYKLFFSFFQLFCTSIFFSLCYFVDTNIRYITDKHQSRDIFRGCNTFLNKYKAHGHQNGESTPKAMAPNLDHYTQINLFGILLSQPEIRLYLLFSDWFGTKWTSVWFKINRRMVNTVWFRVELIRFWNNFSVRSGLLEYTE